MCIVISIGKYRGFGWRLCLGWVAITFFPVDGDFILEQAAEQVNALELLNIYVDEFGSVCRQKARQ